MRRVLLAALFLAGIGTVTAAAQQATIEQTLAAERAKNLREIGRPLTDFERELHERLRRLERRAIRVELLAAGVLVLTLAGGTGLIFALRGRRRLVLASGSAGLQLALAEQQSLRDRQERLAKLVSRFEIAASGWREDLARFERDRAALDRLVASCRGLADETERHLARAEEQVRRAAAENARS
jgi:hypothetical protein